MLFTSLFSLFLWAGIRWSRTVEFGSTTRGQQTPSKFWFWVSTFSLTDSAWSEWERGTFTSWSGLVCELPTWKYTFLFHRQTDHHPRRFRICKDIQNTLCVTVEDPSARQQWSVELCFVSGQKPVLCLLELIKDFEMICWSELCCWETSCECLWIISKTWEQTLPCLCLFYLDKLHGLMCEYAPDFKSHWKTGFRSTL